MVDETGAVEPIAHGAPVSSAVDPDGSLRELAGDCVHCGFCLPACPTYQLWGEEMDSPRGRIHLMIQILDSGQGTAATAEHFDRCLGCMACMTACPSGVQYDQLIEAARTWAEEPEPGPDGGPREPPVAPLPARSRREQATRAAIFATFPYPARLRAALVPLRVAQLLRVDGLAARSKLLGRLAPEAAAALAIAPGRGVRGPRLPARIPARGRRRAVVGMLTGCVQQVLFPQVNAATARVLAADGCDVIVPPGQGCCGALSLHGGRRSEAAGFARTAIEVFEQAGVDAVVVNAAGCGSAMKEHGHLLSGDPGWTQRAAAFSAKVRDFSEFLAELGPVAPRSELPLTVAYHDACHLGHAQRITAQPRSLLRGIPGLALAEIADGGTCCGSAGIYNLVQPEAAAELAARKASNVRATGADLLVSANPGCSLQIAQALAAAGRPMPVAHIAEVIDASISGRGPEALRPGS
jgi:glycolate oxidase iron-sulfur subunit